MSDLIISALITQHQKICKDYKEMFKIDRENLKEKGNE